MQSTTEMRGRIIGAVMGAIIGDALGVGPHWYYKLDKLHKDYGDWIDNYTAPKEGRYHAGLSAGDWSQTGQVYVMLLESLAQKGGYDEDDFTARLDGLLDTLDGTPKSGRYTDHAMRDVWYARKKQNAPWSRTGSFADTAEAAIRAVLPAARHAGDFKRAVDTIISNVLLTHRDPAIAGLSTGFGLIVLALIHGKELSRASKFIPGWAGKAGASLAIPLPADWPGGGEKQEAGFFDAILQPSWSAAAAKLEGISIEPASDACRLFGLACSVHFMLPAAYYFASRFENNFEAAVLASLNGGGNNMARTSLTGALAGAQCGISGIPKRFVTGLAESDRIMGLAEKVADDALADG